MKKSNTKEKLPGFSDRLKAARLKVGFTQQEVADLIGITLRNYQRYEVGETEPSLFNLATIAISLTVSTDWLLGLTDAESADER